MPRIFEPGVDEPQVRPEELPSAEQRAAGDAALTAATRSLRESVDLQAATHHAHESIVPSLQAATRAIARGIADEQRMRVQEIVDAPRREAERRRNAILESFRDSNRKFHAFAMQQALRGAGDRDRAARCRWQRPSARRAPRRRVVRRLVAPRDGPRKSGDDPEPPEVGRSARRRGLVGADRRRT